MGMEHGALIDDIFWTRLDSLVSSVTRMLKKALCTQPHAFPRRLSSQESPCTSTILVGTCLATNKKFFRPI